MLFLALKEEKQKLAGTVTLKFEVNGRKYTNSANIVETERPRRDVSAPSSLIFHRQAAKIQILELSDRHATLVKTKKDDKEAERIQKKIVALSTSTNVISRFTAFVGVDPEKLEIVAMDCARFGQSNKKAGVTEKEESPKDILVVVAELQNLNGFWELEASLADLLDCQLDKLKSAKPEKCEYTDQSLLNLLQ
ncbi:unnamed protein product [Schistocephalus solidus]|uniref:Recombination-associated protein RdgC n=1 Tax=Schistocephalus solidus TaxID=70667 RepID=A0A183SAA2_SCHSO|nr:unnamed protein product [Schistocephalus solidus]